MAYTKSVGSRTLTLTPDLTDIQGMSSANPCVVTWASHGLQTGDYVSFQGITQTDWTNLNGNSYRITVINANSFSIPVNTSTYASYNPTTDPGKVGSDFNVTDLWPGGIKLSAVDWQSSLDGDRLVLREKSANGPVVIVLGGTETHYTIGGKSYSRKLYIKAAEQRWEVPSNVRIIFEFD